MVQLNITLSTTPRPALASRREELVAAKFFSPFQRFMSCLSRWPPEASFNYVRIMSLAACNGALDR